MNKLTIVLAEDEVMVRQGMKALLSQDPGIGNIYEAGHTDEVLALIKQKKPHILLLDVRMPGIPCIELVERIRRDFRKVKILVVTGLFGTELIFNLLKLGIHGFVEKMKGFDEIEKAIDQIMISDRYLSKEVIQVIQENLDRYNSPPPIKLSEKDSILLGLIVEGLTTKAIADKLNIPASTAETNRNRLMKKTGTNNTAELIVYAFRNGII